MVNENNGEHKVASAELAESAVLALAGDGGPGSFDIRDEAAPPSLKTGGAAGVEAPSRSGPHSQRLTLEFEAARASLRAALVQARSKLLAVIQEELHRFSGEVLGNLPEPGGEPVGSGGKGQEAASAPVSRERAERVQEPAEVVTPAGPGGESAALLGQPMAQAPSAQDSVSSDARPLAAEVTPEAPREGTSAPAKAAKPEVPAVLVAESREAPSSQSADGELDEGTVRLSLRVEGCVRQMLDFVNKLSQKRQLRVVRLVGNHREGLDVWVGLREPLCMKKVLLQMEGVATVSDLPGWRASDQKRHLEVWLKDAA